MDVYALGDTIAWIPYVKIFMEKHDCKIICSTFHNDLLKINYLIENKSTINDVITKIEYLV